MKVYGDKISGNCLKVKYTADHLGLPYTWVDVDIMAGGAKTPEFLSKNPQGQVPYVELDGGRVLAQSNAIIRYLAKDSPLLPTDNYLQAKVDEWLFWEQYSHEPYIAVNRFQMKYLGKTRHELESWRVERGEQALRFMDKHLQANPWLVESGISVADIALLAYTRLCHEGGFTLDTTPNVAGWVGRCEKTLGISGP